MCKKVFSLSDNPFTTKKKSIMITFFKNAHITITIFMCVNVENNFLFLKINKKALQNSSKLLYTNAVGFVLPLPLGESEEKGGR